ncbi:hypothetical protein BGZ63DRAFT_497395 [Mariannaea sp. PMI_226]|nr:hypothetical protein BGZ63DRAFT_497395 [Mariannaea sp. PMI_226]
MPQILSYESGEIPVQGAFTAEIHIEARVSLRDMWNDQYQGSQVMGKRPGMYLKYLPGRYHEISGDVLTGGSYLFNTFEEAEEYESWTSSDFKVGEPEVIFWNQPLFKSASHWTWKVIGAHNFKPVDQHAVGRFQRWKYDYNNDNTRSLLCQLYPVLKDGAEQRGATSFWLLYSPKDRMIAIQLSFPKPEALDYDSIQETVQLVSHKPSLGDIFPEALATRLLVDRTSPFLALWLPLAESPKGVHVACPIIPSLDTE